MRGSRKGEPSCAGDQEQHRKDIREEIKTGGFNYWPASSKSGALVGVGELGCRVTPACGDLLGVPASVLTGFKGHRSGLSTELGTRGTHAQTEASPPPGAGPCDGARRPLAKLLPEASWEHCVLAVVLGTAQQPWLGSWRTEETVFHPAVTHSRCSINT